MVLKAFLENKNRIYIHFYLTCLRWIDKNNFSWMIVDETQKNAIKPATMSSKEVKSKYLYGLLLGQAAFGLNIVGQILIWLI